MTRLSTSVRTMLGVANGVLWLAALVLADCHAAVASPEGSTRIYVNGGVALAPNNEIFDYIFVPRTSWVVGAEAARRIHRSVFAILDVTHVNMGTPDFGGSSGGAPFLVGPSSITAITEGLELQSAGPGHFRFSSFGTVGVARIVLSDLLDSLESPNYRGSGTRDLRLAFSIGARMEYRATRQVGLQVTARWIRVQTDRYHSEPSLGIAPISLGVVF